MQYVIPKGGKGKLCGTGKSLLNSATSLLGGSGASSCKGPKLKDDVEVRKPLVGFFLLLFHR